MGKDVGEKEIIELDEKFQLLLIAGNDAMLVITFAISYLPNTNRISIENCFTY